MKIIGFLSPRKKRDVLKSTGWTTIPQADYLFFVAWMTDRSDDFDPGPFTYCRTHTL